MFKLQLAFLLAILAHETISKSSKKHQKKQSIPGHKSHYFLLVGNPVDDGRHHKSLSMILSKESHDEDKSSNAGQTISEAKHPEIKPKPADESLSMQGYSSSLPSEREYSYTEALFTGTPLLNGSPYAITEAPKSHDASGPNSVSSEDRNSGGFGKPSVDKNEEVHNKQIGIAQGQTESHTEGGVSVLEQGKGEAPFSSKSSENATEDWNKEYRQIHPSVDKSQYTTKEESYYNFGPLQAQVQHHSIQNTGSVGSHSALKSYDEESNILDPNSFSHGSVIYDHGHHTFNTDFERTETEHKSDSNLARKPTDSTYWLPEGSDSTFTNSLNNEKVAPDSKANLAHQYTSQGNKQTYFSHKSNNLPYAQDQKQPQEQNISHEQKQSADVNSTHYSVAEPIANTAPSNTAHHRMDGTTYQLRPHKIILSSFDKELTKTMSTGPSLQQNGPVTLARRPLLHKTYSNEHGYQSSQSSNEDVESTPSDFSRQSAEIQDSHQKTSSVPSSEKTSFHQKDSSGQQFTQLPINTEAPKSGQENTMDNNERGPNQEAGNAWISSESDESVKQRQDGPKGDSIQSTPEYSPGEGANGSRLSTSYREGSNPPPIISRDEYLTDRQEASNNLWSSSAEENPANPLRALQKEESLPPEGSHKLEGNMFRGRPVQWALSNDETLTQEWSEQAQNPKFIKQMFYNKGGRAPSMINPLKGSSNEKEREAFRGSSPDTNTSQFSSNYMNEGKNYLQYSRMRQTSSNPPRNQSLKDVSFRPSEASFSRGQHMEPEFQVGVAEQAKETTIGYLPIRANKSQRNTERDYHSQGSEEPRNKKGEENDHDNKNQTIVYFFKMAKGIPLFNNRLIQDHQRYHNETQKSGGLSNIIIKQAPKTVFGVGESLLNNKPIHGQNKNYYNQTHESLTGVGSETQGDVKTEVNGYEMYFDEATRKWWRRPNKRPSWSPRPPQPSPYPSPSTGGGGGALGGSSVDSNEPQADSDFEQEALNTHNKYRKVHGVQDMTLDRDLSNQAKAYAQKIANMGQLVHSSQAERGQSVGENLAYACSSNGVPLTGESTTKMWYDEVCKPGYDFNNGGFSGGTGHFTQVVWKESVKLGIGQGKSTQNGMQCIYAVGRYEIAGNMMGEFQDNVLKGNFDQQYCNNI
ncbi:uncharacterized protein [Montipora foliosa]|uniref:uncharacterized protein n=1 Tax=Montipora foliosa TaxID=591990 RepID=UPI0035F21174